MYKKYQKKEYQHIRNIRKKNIERVLVTHTNEQ